MSIPEHGWLLGLVVMTLGMAAKTPEDLRTPERAGRLQAPGLRECSGLVHSRKIPGRWWALNDSGNAPELFALAPDGTPLGTPVRVTGSRNVDWEELTSDDQGNLWIADTGNNDNRRRDLCLYVVREPDESLPEVLPVVRRIPVRFPDQHVFPPTDLNFDCEAMFFRDGKVYLLTKHRADIHSTLYRLDVSVDSPSPELTLVGRSRNVGMVTGAALHPDGHRLAVLTYNGIWLYHLPEETDDFFSGERLMCPMPAKIIRQCEALDWLDGETLLFSNEQRDLFHVKLDAFGPEPVIEETSP